ncbi:hypothetical protein J6590_006168 [Homalodisca vitripennis]|nr:hypothetical protein J6590_006168 [Homalodisca vitripennis]
MTASDFGRCSERNVRERVGRSLSESRQLSRPTFLGENIEHEALFMIVELLPDTTGRLFVIRRTDSKLTGTLHVGFGTVRSCGRGFEKFMILFKNYHSTTFNCFMDKKRRKFFTPKKDFSVCSGVRWMTGTISQSPWKKGASLLQPLTVKAEPYSLMFRLGILREPLPLQQSFSALD